MQEKQSNQNIRIIEQNQNQFMQNQNIQHQKFNKMHLNNQYCQIISPNNVTPQYFSSPVKILPSQTKTTVYGAGKVNHIIYYFAPFILIAPMISYYMAVKNKQQHPFPHPTITDTACHYPQDIQFRFFMAGSGSFMSFVYFVLFKWIKSQKKRIQYPGPIYGGLHLISQISVWGFMTAMGTIDGAWYPQLHDISAVFFFIVLFLLVITHTIVLRDMYQWDPSVMSKFSYWTKSILGGYVAIVWIFTVIGLATHPSQGNDDENEFIVILQWNTVYVCVFWIISYIPDWKNLHFSLTQYIKQ